MSEHRSDAAVEGALPARLIRKFALPILLIWIAIAGISNTMSALLLSAT